ncbi:hypothetical protein HDV01_006235 [Terramyces sp. JEL0728]|nr:hypothetical protein HDV01_006235 [Terramyces sp. JEL0728]
MANTLEIQPGPNESWAPYFYFVDWFTIPGTCGYLAIETKYSCCVSSLNYEYSQPYMSGAPQYFDSIDQVANYLPKEMINSNYCRLERQDYNDFSSIYGYHMIYLHGNNNTCVDGWFTCSTDGTFTAFNYNSSCTGYSEVYALTSSEQTFTSPLLGNFIGQFQTIEVAPLYIQWVTYAGNQVIPQFDNGGTIFAAIVFAIAIMIALLMVTKTVVKYWDNRTNLKLIVVLIVVCQLFWLLWVILKLVYWIGRFSSNEQLALLGEFMALAIGIASLTSTWVSNTMLYAAFQINSKMIKNGLPIAIFILHFALAGNTYWIYWLNGGAGGLSAQEVKNILQWGEAKVYWIMFMLVWNCSIPIGICLKLVAFVGNGKIKSRLKALHSADALLFPCLILQIIAFAFYYIINNLNTYSAALYDDFTVLNLNPYNTLCLVLHSALTIRIVDAIKNVSRTKFTTTVNMQNASTVIAEKSSYQSQSEAKKTVYI